MYCDEEIGSGILSVDCVLEDAGVKSRRDTCIVFVLLTGCQRSGLSIGVTWWRDDGLVNF